MSVRIARLDQSATVLSTLTAGSALDRALQVAAVLFVTALTAVAAQVSVPVPFTPVPFTLQPMVVLLGGAALGARLGQSGPGLNLLVGIAADPVRAASAVLPLGIFRLLGPTGGYLMSYPFAAFLTGALAERGFDRRYVTSVIAMGAGLAVVFTCGVLWLAWFARPASAGLDAALRTGLYPFLPADIIKVCLAAAIMPGVWWVLGTRKH
jgi:biotin transport system substrate-specific component